MEISVRNLVGGKTDLVDQPEAELGDGGKGGSAHGERRRAAGVVPINVPINTPISAEKT